MTTSKEFKEEIAKQVDRCLEVLDNLVRQINEANEKNFIVEKFTSTHWNGKEYYTKTSEYEKPINPKEFKQMVKLVAEITGLRHIVYNSDLWETVYQRENFPYDFKE